jgi:DNA invertase Pin-like site-specific DNA recombinase
MNPKITPEHLSRGAVVYVRQSTPSQVVEHTESRRNQYSLADTARAMGFSTVEVIDDDLGRSGSGLVERPGFQRLVAAVCAGGIGAVFCIEASRLARNGRDWHHLIDLCALVGSLVIDPDGVYEPRSINDRLLLGLKGTMSEYELSLLRQRSQAARDSKAKRGELRFGLPPGYCWDELGQVVMDPDDRVSSVVRLVLRKFLELGSARQVLLWVLAQEIDLPVMSRSPRGMRIEWRRPAYHNVLLMIQSPIYAGAYAFGRTESRTRVVEGRAVRTSGHRRPRDRWPVLLRDHHPGYISWDEFERNQRTLEENAHMKQRTARKSARGGRALLSGLLRCGRCGRMLRVFYGSGASPSHQYLCVGDQMRGSQRLCLNFGGVRVDRAVSAQLLAVVDPHAVEAALEAAARAQELNAEVRQAFARELEDAEYEAKLAARRHEAVDPAKRLVARELEARWETALQRAREIEEKIANAERKAADHPAVDREKLLHLAADLPAVWNAPTSDMRIKQRLMRIVVHEVIADGDGETNEIVLTIHWVGGRHSEVRVARVRCGRYPEDRKPSAATVMRKLGGRWPDRQLAVTMNRMRCRTSDGATWTVVRVRELRERLGIPEFDPCAPREETISLEDAARRLSICVGSVYRLIRDGVLPASQLMPSAPWEIPVAAIDSEAVRIGVRRIVDRRPRNFAKLQDTRTLRLPGV